MLSVWYRPVTGAKLPTDRAMPRAASGHCAGGTDFIFRTRMPQPFARIVQAGPKSLSTAALPSPPAASICF